MSNIQNNKRKQPIVQPLYVKVNALKELKNGVDESVIANNLNVHVRTVREWKKKEEEILELQKEVEGVKPKETKRAKKARNEVLDKAVWEWFKERRKSGVSLDGPSIKKQALAFHQTLGYGNEKFLASNDWLHKFRIRHKICSLIVTGEKNSADGLSAENFIPVFADYVRTENLSEHQIFNCNEFGLNFKSMPEPTSEAAEFQQTRDRLAVMACSNVSGSLKLPLVVIEKYSQPNPEKNVILSNTFPVFYRSQKNAWMNSKLFSEWFHSEFAPKVTKFLENMKLPLKAVLLVDNCSSHPKELLQEENFKTYFLPTNTAVLIQPMDQGILQCLKSKYRQKIMEYISNCLEDGREIRECVEVIDLENVIYWIAESWDEIPLSVIKESWKHLWPGKISHQNLKEAETIHLAISNDTISKFITLIQGISAYKDFSYNHLHKWLHLSTVMTPDEALTDEELIQIIQDEAEDEKRNCDDDNDGDSSSNENYDGNNFNFNSNDVVSRQEAKDELKKVIKYCENELSQFFAEKLTHLYQLEMAFDNDEFEDIKTVIVDN